MSRAKRYVFVVSIVWCVVSTAYYAHRGGLLALLQLLIIPLSICFFAAIIISFVCIFTEWRQRRWRSLLPFTACVLSVVVSCVLVQTIRPVIFAWSLPSYEAVIQQIESGKIPVSDKLNLIPQAKFKARLVYAVFAQKDTNGVLSVAFFTEGGFPVKHSGYLYSSSGVVEPGSPADSEWPIRHEVRKKWFYISD